MKSIRTGTVTPRCLASAWMRSIWWLLPSTRATQVRELVGSRRWAWSKTVDRTAVVSWTTLAVNHLLVAFGAGVGVSELASTSAAVRDTGVRSYTAPTVAILLRVALFSLGQPGGQLARRGPGGGLGGRSQRVGSHHDALAVEGQHQGVAGVGRLLRAGCVEVGHVGGGPRGQGLHLAFGRSGAGSSTDRPGGVVERAVRGGLGGQPTQPVRVTFVR